MPKGYVGYYCGKAIKMDLSKDVIDGATLYDRQNGEGLCERVVSTLVEKRVEKSKAKSSSSGYKERMCF